MPAFNRSTQAPAILTLPPPSAIATLSTQFWKSRKHSYQLVMPLFDGFTVKQWQAGK
jgi:hypothetical protein